MRSSRSLACLLLALWLPAFAQHRRVAITVDDLPYASGEDKLLSPADARLAQEINRKLLAGFGRHHVPVTGFVIGNSVENLGAESGTTILRKWVAHGFDLGNHTYSHPDINMLSVSEIENEVVRTDAILAPLLKQSDLTKKFFRFPMNHTGDSQAKHDAISAFLEQRGYKLAACTIDNSDYLFNSAYVSMLAKKDTQSAGKLRSEYLTYTSSEIDYYAALNKKVLGYEPPQVMLLHDNQLNADVIDDVLKLFEEKKYTFVRLSNAQSDPAYSIPDTYITKYGPMWGYRWAKERNIQVNGRLESEPPQWIVDYPKSE